MKKTLSQTTYKVDCRNVILIEDDADSAEITDYYLKRKFPALELIWHYSPEQALAYFERNRTQIKRNPCLIIMDVYLPEKADGIGLLKTLKNDDTFKLLPVVVLSQSGTSSDISELYEHGCSAYMAKPSGKQDWERLISTLVDWWWNVVTIPKLL